MTHNWLIIIVAFPFLCISCTKFQKKDDSNCVNFETALKPFKITKEQDRGCFMVNQLCLVSYSECALPKKCRHIDRKIKPIVAFGEEKEYVPRLSDIPIPFVVYKTSYSDTVYCIYKQDTIPFIIK